MNEQLFRKKSIDRVSSPEQLNEYIRVSNPSVWILLTAIVVLLIGVCVWGVFGRLDTELSVVAIAENGNTTVFVKEADIASIEKGMTVTVGDKEYKVAEISAQPIAVDGAFTEYALHVGGLQVGEWVYAVSIDGELPEGVHQAEIVIDSVSPMSFVLN